MEEQKEEVVTTQSAEPKPEQVETSIESPGIDYSRNPLIKKFTTNIYGITLFLLVIMAFRFISGLTGIKDIKLLLKEGGKIATVGTIANMEIALTAMCLIALIVAFVFVLKLYRDIKFNKECAKRLDVAKNCTIMIVACMAIYAVFELVALIMTVAIYNASSIALSVTVYASIVWSMVFVVFAVMSLLFTNKLKKELK